VSKFIDVIADTYASYMYGKFKRGWWFSVLIVFIVLINYLWNEFLFGKLLYLVVFEGKRDFGTLVELTSLGVAVTLVFVITYRISKKIQAFKDEDIAKAIEDI